MLALTRILQLGVLCASVGAFEESYSVIFDALKHQATDELIMPLIEPTICSQKHHGSLPIHFAIWHDSSTEIITKLIEVCGALDARTDTHGNTPLHIAARRAAPEIVALLLESYPAAMRIRDEHDDLPLHHAAFHRATTHASVTHTSIEVLNKLISAYPEALSEKNDRGLRPIDLADDARVKSLLARRMQGLERHAHVDEL
jgi:ankyrin repeat protein